MLRFQPRTFFAICSLAFTLSAAPARAAQWKIGFGKTDVTPAEPVRLSGYATRELSHESVADPLNVRAMVLSPNNPDSDASSVVLVSIDSILVTSAMTVEISQWLLAEYGVARNQLALSSTHSHAAPHVAGGLKNLYREPSTEQQSAATAAYTRQMVAAIKSSIHAAFQSRELGEISIGEAQAGFAVNRRVLKNGTWTGFGEQMDGPVDRRVRVMRAQSLDGRILGGAFLYATHCTTLGGDFNQISSDWAGLAASRLEVIHADAVFLPVIGCGADSNPNPRGTYDLAQQHAAEIVDSVTKVLKQNDLQSIDDFPIGHFGYAGLAPEQPTSERIQAMAASDRSNERVWAESMTQIRKEMGRLPETYPMPIHTWQFGDELTWVFLGGEVVVDYQFRVERELPTKQTWVAAYTDDVFAYVASEAMRAEGGYEVDFSMIYYLQPGRWESGTQTLIVRRVTEIFNNQLTESRPLSATEALKSIRVPDGFTVELVASEPLVKDPINIAFGDDGRVWVVEMSDYPTGVNGGGRVKWLKDSDGDGTLDLSQVFIDDLSYPTSVAVWRDGIVVIAAPDILFAADRNGDGVAEVRETWLTGIGAANPQHRASGFEVGLDGWLHFSSGDGTVELRSLKNEKTYNVAHRDVAWNPDSGEIRTTSGETQFVRARDAFGNWFGNSNSRPVYQYVIEDRYLDQASISGGVRFDLLTPGVAPPVYPTSNTVDRFNDLFALNRFTSACSSIVARVPGIASVSEPSGTKRMGASLTGFICEPVHNLVARIQIDTQGSHFTASRHPQDVTFDFFTSTDPWSRPVRVVNAPDGSIWVLDMVRKVIEHPEWIPTAWQERIDLRAGENLGRIYRVFRSDYSPVAWPTLTDAPDSLVKALSSENGVVRDWAMQRIVQTNRQEVQPQVRRLAQENPSAEVRVSALGCLTGAKWLTQSDVAQAFTDEDPRVVRYALEVSESLETIAPELIDEYLSIPKRALGPQVDLQWVLTSTVLSAEPSSRGDAMGRGLETIAARSQGDLWINRAMSLVRDPKQAFAVAVRMIDAWDSETEVSNSAFNGASIGVTNLWKRATAEARIEFANQRFARMVKTKREGFSASDLLLMTVLSRASQLSGLDENLLQQVSQLARARMLDPNASQFERLVLVELLGGGILPANSKVDDARTLLRNTNSPELKQRLIESLRSVESPEVPSLVLACWNGLSSGQRTTACATLLSRKSWAASLVDALESGTILPSELAPATIQQLRSHGDRNLRARCLAVFGRPTARGEVVATYLAKMPTPSVSVQSESLFREHCATCHTAQEGKPTLGPPLENLKQWTIDQWVTAIIDPNRNVEPKYHQTQVLTQDGNVFAGIVAEQNEQGLRLAQSDGSIREVANDEIESTQPTTISLMPEGFESKLTPETLAELLGYLRQEHSRASR